MTPQRRAAVETADLSPAAPPAPLTTPVANGAGQTSPLLPVLTGRRRLAAAGISSPAGGEPSANADGTSSPPGGSRALSAGQLAIAAAMSEAELTRRMQRFLKDLKDHGYPLLAYHTWTSVHSSRGFPDWVFCGPRGVLYREFKKQRGIVTQAQQEWLDGLTRAGQDAAVRRPSDLLSGKIAAELAALAGLRGQS